MIQRTEIEAAFGEALVCIRDERLVSATLDCWMLGVEEGGWRSMADLHAMPSTLLVDTGGVSIIQHTLAVTMGARGLAEAQMRYSSPLPYEINMDLLTAGGILHDVGKLLEMERGEYGEFVRSHSGRCTRHPISGAVLAAKAGLSLEIQNIIACHASEGDGRAQRVETVLIHQTDFATFNPLVMTTKGSLIT